MKNKPTPKQILEILGTDPRYVTRDQLSWLTRGQWSWLTRGQLSGLTRDQLEIVGLKNVPILENPYTQILAAVKTGALEMSTWHKCETTHCVGGWTVTLTPGGK